jgi:tetratricopeptide (TPR) repeat protein
MKIKLLMAGLLGLVSATTFAQKGELRNAQSSYNDYDVSKGSKIALLVTKANTSLNDAKTAIDKASANEKTANLPETYALKGAIYAALANQDTIPATAAPLLGTAKDAISKAKELDTKGENKKLIQEADLYLAVYYQNMGVKQYQSGKYDLAYQSFDNWNQAQPDTTAVYYAALAASNQGNTDPKYYKYAIDEYNKLITTNYSENAKIYKYLATLYVITKDTTNALKVIAEGVQKYPTNSELRELEIRIGLQAGKENEILGKIQSAIRNDLKNKTLYYYEGLTYSRIADATNEKAEKAKDDATKKSLYKAALADYDTASVHYEEAIALDPNYFDANLNLGYTLMRPAIDIYNEARMLPVDQQKQYLAMRQKADAQFDLAKPYLQKAVDINPKSVDALNNLRNYYRGKYDPAHQAENTAKANDLEKQINALPPSGKN